MSNTDAIGQPGTSPAGNFQAESWGSVRPSFPAPSLLRPPSRLILIFAIFPTFYSIVFALSRVRFTANGLQFPLCRLQNFAKQFSGTEQEHFLGKIGKSASWAGRCLLPWPRRSLVAIARSRSPAGLAWWAVSSRPPWPYSSPGDGGVAPIRNPIGTLLQTLFYVFVLRLAVRD